MSTTSLSRLAVVFLAISVAKLSTTGQAYEVPIGSMDQNGYLVAYRDIVRMLLEKQPIIYQEIMSGQLRPGNQMQGNQLPSPVVQPNYNTIPGINSMEPPRPTGLQPNVNPYPMTPVNQMQARDLFNNDGRQMQHPDYRFPSQFPGNPGQPHGPNQFHISDQMPGPFALSGQCVPSRTKPILDTAQQFTNSIVTSVEGSAMASLVGYVKFSNLAGSGSHEPTYLPVDINSLSVSEPDRIGVRTVSLTGPCLSFDIKYKLVGGRSNDKNDYQYRSIEMRIKNDAERDTAPKKICELAPFVFKQPATSRYYCKPDMGGWSHECSKDGQPIASLVLNSFELELDSDFDLLKRSEFSKLKWGNSCDRWDKSATYLFE